MKYSRILLTGCHGLLGQRIVQKIPEDTFVYGVDIDDQPLIHGKFFNYAKIDITDRSAILDHSLQVVPDCIINCAAMTNVDLCETERELCWKLNVEAVENLVQCAKKVKAKLIHISSDYIFDNSREFYREDDRSAPLSYYGKSKLAGENAVRMLGSNWAIARTSTLYDVDTLKNRDNFVSWVVKSLQNGDPIRIVTDQWGNPTLARNLADAVWKIVQSDATGLFHTAGKTVTDRFAFTERIAALFGCDMKNVTKIITEDLKQAAVRPLKIGLDVSKAEAALDMKMYNLDEGLAAFKNDFLLIHRNN